MNGITQENKKKISEIMCNPEGTFAFEYKSEDLVDPTVRGAIIFEVVAGKHFFKLERTDDLLLRLFHASPGTGTRVSTIDLKGLGRIVEAFIAFSWSPDELSLYFGPRNPGDELISSRGVRSSAQFRIGDDGNVYRIGDDNIEVMDLKIMVNDQTVLQCTAIEAWKSMKRAISILLSERSDEDYLREVVMANLCISMAVTGFEAYCKNRFIELESEGVRPNIKNLTEITFSKSDRDAKLPEKKSNEATKNGKTFLRWIIDKRCINFQNFKDCSKAYKKVYGVEFSQIFPNAKKTKWLQNYITHRHSVIHVSADNAMLDLLKPPVPINSSRSKEALDIFDEFIMALHEASLKIR